MWPDSFVEEMGLSRNISLLRQALADDAQSTIVTVARIGYRFAAPVVVVESSTASIGGGEAEARPQPGPQTLTRLLILPFRMLRDDADTKFLAFGVPDAVVSALGGVESLVVRSSAAAARFGERPDLTRVAAEAEVDAVVTGTLLRSGEQLRMNAQLVSVPSGTVLWSQSLQVALGEAFALQDSLVEHIVAALSLTLTARERRRLKADVPASATAYELFLRGNESVGPQAIASSSNLRVARQLYERSVEEDPRFAPAWARLGRCHYLIGKADEHREQNFARADTCFRRALELSPDLPLAHNLYALFEIDQGSARSAMVRLISGGSPAAGNPSSTPRSSRRAGSAGSSRPPSPRTSAPARSIPRSRPAGTRRSGSSETKTVCFAKASARIFWRP